MHWLFLGIAIIAEIFGSSMLKMSDGFTRLFPSMGVIVGYILSFYLLSLALKGIPLSAAYAIWSGIGLVLTALVSIIFFGQRVDIGGLIGIGLILLGVVVLNVFSQMVKH